MSEPTPSTPENLHVQYCEQLRQSFPLRYHWHRLWLEFIRAEFTIDDLALVLRYLLREVRAGKRNPGALKLTNLLQIDRFEEDLVLARLEYKPAKSVVAPNRPRGGRQTVRVETQQEKLVNLDLLRACRIQLANRSDPLQ